MEMIILIIVIIIVALYLLLRMQKKSERRKQQRREKFQSKQDTIINQVREPSARSSRDQRVETKGPK